MGEKHRARNTPAATSGAPPAPPLRLGTRARESPPPQGRRARGPLPPRPPGAPRTPSPPPLRKPAFGDSPASRRSRPHPDHLPRCAPSSLGRRRDGCPAAKATHKVIEIEGTRGASEPGFLLKWLQGRLCGPAPRVPCGRAAPGPAGLSSRRRLHGRQSCGLRRSAGAPGRLPATARARPARRDCTGKRWCAERPGLPSGPHGLLMTLGAAILAPVLGTPRRRVFFSAPSPGLRFHKRRLERVFVTGDPERWHPEGIGKRTCH